MSHDGESWGGASGGGGEGGAPPLPKKGFFLSLGRSEGAQDSGEWIIGALEQGGDAHLVGEGVNTPKVGSGVGVLLAAAGTIEYRTQSGSGTINAARWVSSSDRCVAAQMAVRAIDRSAVQAIVIDGRGVSDEEWYNLALAAIRLGSWLSRELGYVDGADDFPIPLLSVTDGGLEGAKTPGSEDICWDYLNAGAFLRLVGMPWISMAEALPPGVPRREDVRARRVETLAYFATGVTRSSISSIVLNTLVARALEEYVDERSVHELSELIKLIGLDSEVQAAGRSSIEIRKADRLGDKETLDFFKRIFSDNSLSVVESRFACTVRGSNANYKRCVDFLRRYAEGLRVLQSSLSGRARGIDVQVLPSLVAGRHLYRLEAQGGGELSPDRFRHHDFVDIMGSEGGLLIQCEDSALAQLLRMVSDAPVEAAGVAVPTPTPIDPTSASEGGEPPVLAGGEGGAPEPDWQICHTIGVCQIRSRTERLEGHVQFILAGDAIPAKAREIFSRLFVTDSKFHKQLVSARCATSCHFSDGIWNFMGFNPIGERWLVGFATNFNRHITEKLAHRGAAPATPQQVPARRAVAGGSRSPIRSPIPSQLSRTLASVGEACHVRVSRDADGFTMHLTPQPVVRPSIIPLLKALRSRGQAHVQSDSSDGGGKVYVVSRMTERTAVSLAEQLERITSRPAPAPRAVARPASHERAERRLSGGSGGAAPARSVYGGASQRSGVSAARSVALTVAAPSRAHGAVVRGGFRSVAEINKVPRRDMFARARGGAPAFAAASVSGRSMAGSVASTRSHMTTTSRRGGGMARGGAL